MILKTVITVMILFTLGFSQENITNKNEVFLEENLLTDDAFFISIFNLEKDCKFNKHYFCSKENYIHKDFKIEKIDAEIFENNTTELELKTVQLKNFEWLKNGMFINTKISEAFIQQEKDTLTFTLKNVSKEKTFIDYSSVVIESKDISNLNKNISFNFFKNDKKLSSFSTDITLVENNNTVSDLIINSVDFKMKPFIFQESEKSELEKVEFYIMIRQKYKIDFLQKTKEGLGFIDLKVINKEKTTIRNYFDVYLLNILNPKEALKNNLYFVDYLFNTLSVIENKEK